MTTRKAALDSHQRAAEQPSGHRRDAHGRPKQHRPPTNDAGVDGGGGEHDVFCTCCRGIITTLPHELLVGIFSLLSVREVCLQVSLTCRAWHTLAHDQLLWQRMFIAYFAEELVDKANRYHHLRLRQELKWRVEFQHCVRSSSRDIRVFLRQGPHREMTEITVNVRDPIKLLLKKASLAFNIAVPQKLVFSFVEANHGSPSSSQEGQARCEGGLRTETPASDDRELGYRHWMEMEDHEESVMRSHFNHSFGPSTGLGADEINRVRRLFLQERRRQRLARLTCHQAIVAQRQNRALNDDVKEGRRQVIALVVIEDGDGPHQRVENNKVNPPIVTYYVNSLGPKEERVGHFLIDGCVGTCLIARHFLIDM